MALNLVEMEAVTKLNEIIDPQADKDRWERLAAQG